MAALGTVFARPLVGWPNGFNDLASITLRAGLPYFFRGQAVKDGHPCPLGANQTISVARLSACLCWI
jgi:hypothetical protein